MKTKKSWLRKYRETLCQRGNEIWSFGFEHLSCVLFLQMAGTTAPQVKLEPGNGARLAMFSARFNAKNKETWIAVMAQIEAVFFFWNC